MKKSKLQVIIDFIAQVKKIKDEKKETPKVCQKQTIRKISLFALLILSIHSTGFALTYYSRLSGNWNVNSTWSTIGYGNPTNTGTFPQAGDIVNIGNGYTINITGNVNCATLNIGQGISGTLQYASAANYTASVSGNVTINTGANLWYTIPVSRTHQLNIGGNLVNFGNVDLYNAAGQVVNLAFNTSTNSNVTGTGTWDLNNVTLAKTVTTSTQLNIQSNTFEAGIKTFIGSYGTYVHNNTSSYNINPTLVTFTIGPNMIYNVPMGTMSFGSNTDNVILQGSLYVNGGTVFIGRTSGLQGLRTDRNGTFTPYLEVSSGTLIVYGGITYNSTSSLEPFSFRMSGGSILLNAGTTGSNRQIFFVTDRAGSSFNMTGGTITIQKPTLGGALNSDFSVCGTMGSVTSTGGTVHFGNGMTPSGARFNFRPNANVTFPHFRISGQAGMPNTLATSFSSTANFRLLSLYIETSKIFDIRSIAGTSGDSKTMTLMGTTNGVDALYNNGNFNARQSTVTFNTSGAQAIGGTQVTNFYNLSINNINGITLNRAAYVSNYLSMVNGKLNTTSTNILTCGSNANASLGTSTSYVDGPMVHTVASAAASSKTYPIGKGSAFRAVVLTVTHSNATPVTYQSEVFNSPASALPYSYPPTIATVSHVRYTRFIRQNVANFTSGIIQMYYNVDDVVADRNTLVVAQDDGVSMWQNHGGTATANWTGNITSNTFTTFNRFFALANPPGGGNPLPIELSVFSVNLNNKKVDVKWTTESEINNDYFTVERSSDNETFIPISVVDGAGNASTSHNYIFTDAKPLKGISYYRLTQTDFDGTSKTFQSAVVNNESTGSFSVYPNPSTTGKVKLTSDEAINVNNISVQDITGKTIPSETVVRENGTIDLNIDEKYTSKGGIFIITLSDGQKTARQKLLVN
jgi:hypothetical protein